MKYVLEEEHSYKKVSKYFGVAVNPIKKKIKYVKILWKKSLKAEATRTRSKYLLKNLSQIY